MTLEIEGTEVHWVIPGVSFQKQRMQWGLYLDGLQCPSEEFAHILSAS